MLRLDLLSSRGIILDARQKYSGMTIPQRINNVIPSGAAARNLWFNPRLSVTSRRSGQVQLQPRPADRAEVLAVACLSIFC
jgi:hypothetical protein